MAQQYPQNDYYPMPEPPPRRRFGVLSVVCALILVLSVAVILNETLLRLKDIQVKGVYIISQEEAKKAAGLDRTVSYFTVSEKKVAEGINSHHYLTFERMEKRFPDTLTVYVKERVPVARVDSDSRHARNQRRGIHGISSGRTGAGADRGGCILPDSRMMTR